MFMYKTFGKFFLFWSSKVKFLSNLSVFCFARLRGYRIIFLRSSLSLSLLLLECFYLLSYLLRNDEEIASAIGGRNSKGSEEKRRDEISRQVDNLLAHSF